MSFSKTHQMDESRRIDFLFSELAPDLIGGAETIHHTFFGQAPSAAARAAMKAYLEDHRREKTGNQPRSLEDFHLTAADVAFSEYSELFLVSSTHRPTTD